MTIFYGIIEYNVLSSDPTLGAINIGGFLLVWLAFEITYQYTLRNGKVTHLTSLERITTERFEALLKAGEKLVLLDDLVIDVS